MTLLSVIIPVLDESGNVGPLSQEIIGVLDQAPQIKGDFEIIFVDDGSRDSTPNEIAAVMAKDQRIRMLRHEQRLGASTAIRHGVMAAQSEWICTCDGDGQNDPADIPALLGVGWARGRERSTMVCGVRVNRQDTWRKRRASRLANGIRRWWLKDKAPDTGCALKLFRRDAYLALPFFTSLHRFMPALFLAYGHEVLHTPINDRPRLYGRSKSDLVGRALRGSYDLIGVQWLIKRAPSARTYMEYHRRPPAEESSIHRLDP
jgi:dolichol-phosphate mannosyltransferase